MKLPASPSSSPGALSVGLDGVIFSYQRHGGITRMLSALLPRLCELGEGPRIEFWTWSCLATTIPEHRCLAHRRIPYVSPLKRVRPALFRRALRRLTDGVNERSRRRAVSASSADLWHATLYWRPPKWHGRLVTTVYDLKEELFPDLASSDILRYKRDAILAADQVLCISETTRRDVMNCYDVEPERLCVAPLAVEPELFRPDRLSINSEDGVLTGGVLTSGPFILFVGRRDRFKNFDVLVEAYRRWRQRSEFRLVAAGNALTNRERQRLDQAGLADRVTVLSGIGEEQLAELYRSASALVYPSLYEGFGLPILEAMACGCPVVAARIPSSREVGGPEAFFFEAEEPDSLVEALDQAVALDRAHPRLHQGIARSREYSWDATARMTLETYRKAMGQPMGEVAPL